MKSLYNILKFFFSKIMPILKEIPDFPILFTEKTIYYHNGDNLYQLGLSCCLSILFNFWILKEHLEKYNSCLFSYFYQLYNANIIFFMSNSSSKWQIKCILTCFKNIFFCFDFFLNSKLIIELYRNYEYRNQRNRRGHCCCQGKHRSIQDNKEEENPQV